jgi:hypothetical protein
VFENKTHFFSTIHPDIIEESLLNYLMTKENEISDKQFSEKKYKYVFSIKTQDQHKISHTVRM